MQIHTFLSPPAETARRHGPNDRIVMSSRVRLARNVRDYAFPGWAKKPERVKVLELIRPAVESLPEMSDAFSEAMDNLTSLDKQILVERHLISREHAAKTAGSGLVLNREETFCVMINEEDHLRMQALRPGLQLRQAWNAIDRLDTALEKKLDYAFSNELGYLTACPTNLGTGIRVSAMLHLPGLVLAEHINPIIQSVNKLGLAVRGLYGEGTEALGNVFQVVYNHIGRAYGTLANAHSITSKETMNFLSLLRLGVDMGVFPGTERSLVDELFLTTQPAHLQRKLSDKLSAEERDILRADMLRECLKNVGRPLVKKIEPRGLDKPPES